jgi:hypothetical protein
LKRPQKPRRAKARLKKNSMLLHNSSRNRLRETLKKERPNSMSKQTWKPISEPLPKQRKRKTPDKLRKQPPLQQLLKLEKMQSKPQEIQVQLPHKLRSFKINLQHILQQSRAEIQRDNLQTPKNMNTSKPLKDS